MDQKKKNFVSKYASVVLITGIAGISFFVPYQRADAVGVGMAQCVSSLLGSGGLGLGSGITSSIAGQRVPTEPVVLVQKETVQDPCTKAIVKEIVHELTTSIVNWINNGFEGGPTFVTNPGAFFGDIADQTAGAFIQGAGLDFLCTPFKLDIQIGLRNVYRNEYENRAYCTPTRIAQVQKYTSDNFEDIGWDGWLDLTTHDENNVYGSWVQSNNDLNNAVNYRINKQLQELNWGNGFLSIKDPETGEIQTPGTLIVGQADQVLGNNLRELEIAKEFDDIIYALINQLTNQLLTKGLRN